MLAIQGVTKFIGERELFKGVSFSIRPGERIGLIGPNGAGKTTLFHILLGEITPDEGSVTKSRGLSLGYLPQQFIPPEDKTVLAHAMDIHRQLHELRDEVRRLQENLEMESDPALSQELAFRQAHLFEQVERLGGYDIEARAARILKGLGFRDSQFDMPVPALSGGWLMRLELARLLLSEPDLLLLDEPTNHLDLLSLLWLEEYLLNTSSAMLIVSHDRFFLNKLAQRVIELEQGRLDEYAGNYDFYVAEKAKRQEIRLASYKNQQDRIRQVDRFIERNRYRKSSAARAQSRLKLLDKMDKIEAPVTERPEIHFAFPPPLRSGKRVLELRQVHKAYGDHKVYSGIDLVLERGDRVAFIGENGAGKTTLLKMLAGAETVTEGERALGHQVSLGYYAQHQWEQLRPERTVLDEAGGVSGDLPTSQLRALLGAFLFPGDDVLKKVAVLSGGEKARLILCKLLLQRPNALLLDEPTNHLDIPSREVLEQALGAFSGTICFISHDRLFINKIANKILLVEKGRIHLFPGNYDDFQNIWKDRLGEDPSAADGPGAGDGGRAARDKPARREQTQKKLEAEWRNELYRAKKPVQERLEQIEAEIERVHRELDVLNAVLADPNTYQNGEDVQKAQKDYGQCQGRIRELTRLWEESALALEEIEENYSRLRDKAGSG